MFNKSIQTVSSAATVLFGTAFLTIATVGIATPARAEAAAGFAKSVEVSIDDTLRFPAGANHRTGIVTVSVSVAADGTVTGTSVAKSSGVAVFDAEALRTAKSVRYPATGKARTVAMVLGFGKRTTVADRAKGQQIVDAQRNDSRRLLATETTARPAG